MTAAAPVARAGGSVALIGMPGAGKSTVGVLLAKYLGLRFVDTDILIQKRAGRRLQQILDDGVFFAAHAKGDKDEISE